MDRLQVPRVDAGGRGRVVILCRGPYRCAGGRLARGGPGAHDSEVIGMKQWRPATDKPVRVVRYTCPKCGRWLEEVAGRSMTCVLCRARMTAEKRGRGEQDGDR